MSTMDSLSAMLALGAIRADMYASPTQSITLTLSPSGLDIKGVRKHRQTTTGVRLGATVEISLRWESLRRLARADERGLIAEIDHIARRLDLKAGSDE